MIVTFTGGPTAGTARMEYIATPVESSTAAAILITGTGPRTRGPSFAVGYVREIAVDLNEPLGNRVLVDATTGAPLPVTT